MIRLETHFQRVFASLAALLVAALAVLSLGAEISARSAAGDAERERLETAARAALRDAREVLIARERAAPPTGATASSPPGASATPLPHASAAPLPHASAASLIELGRAMDVRLTLIEEGGAVIVDSASALTLVDSGTRPEGSAATREASGSVEPRSATSGPGTIHAALRIEEGGRVLGGLRAASDGSTVASAVSRSRRTIALVALAGLATGLAGAYLAARALTRPLLALESDAARLAAGGSTGRVRADGPREVRELAASIEALARVTSERLEGVQRARRELETILSSMAEGVVAVDGHERVLLMNQAAAALLGLDGRLASGAHLWQEVRFPELERALRQALSGAGGWSGDAFSPLQNGRVLRLSVAPVAREIADGEHAFQGAVALLSDVTALRRLEQVRIDFVANVSHELRTPLAAVMGALETLGDRDTDGAVRERFLDIANRNAARLQAIVSDLLDLSQIEAEGDRMPLEPVRLDQPLRTAASALSGAAESKQIRLELPPPLAEPVWVNGNVQRLEQVFTNLLENAIKYTPAGGRVAARVRPSQKDASVDVEDSGVGIPAASLPRVFERFYRVDRSRSRDMGGTGLGLAIVKHVLRAHGGAVSVESVEGRGSTFTVTLPRIHDPKERRGEAA